MDHLLSLSQAARMVGVPRRNLQQHIRAGRLSVFEGEIRLSELLRIFPEANAGGSRMVERMERIKDGAVFKSPGEKHRDPEYLAAEVHRLRLQLGETRTRLESYQQMAGEMKSRLLELQDQCDRKQAVVIGAHVGWFLHQCKLREQR